MKLIKLCWGLCMGALVVEYAFCCDQKTIPETQSLIYVKNSSEYPVRVSAGPEYPSSVALYPGQIVEFPLKHVPTITASTYGKVSHYFAGLVAELNITKLLQDHPEYATKDNFVDITYETNSGKGSGLWSLARYLFTQGKWSLSFANVDQDKDLSQYFAHGVYSHNLFAIISKASRFYT